MLVHGKPQENILLNISSRPCSALRNYDMGTTPTEVQHALVNTKQKQKQKQNANGKLRHYKQCKLLPTTAKCNLLPSAVTSAIKTTLHARQTCTT